ncbi:MAG TPA: guanylate kinase [Anaerohalosphaeraceae bacterium]|nr:guanylate kinase [Anaerohalosphaeraceae bacterium]HOL30860.1 guanylate kinase [Anaerohalosphaeraceae bacterium]HOM76569.1 guanylate kinase [Anaerohalosphaeraceae bacterium]HPC64967.1 guanylate kinase [Anaerohalosphaeraceae bacterium]HRS72171.1 guanylate kinase [Anaerohalosphaeraceae bacterium]
MTNAQAAGKLVVISGPSGVGKSTICRRIVEKRDAFLSVSATTRKPGASEENGRDYWFVSRQEFERRIRAGEFLEYADVFGNYYGTPRPPVEKALAEGRTVILEIDVQGGLQVRQKCPEAVLIFILPPRPEDLQQRMRCRGRGEDEASRKRRLETAEKEIAAARKHYDYFVVNADLDAAIQEVMDIIDGICKGNI